MSNELLQKVIDTTNLGTTPTNNLSGDGITNSGTGLLYPDQANRFLDYMWDATILAKSALFVCVQIPLKLIVFLLVKEL